MHIPYLIAIATIFVASAGSAHLSYKPPFNMTAYHACKTKNLHCKQLNEVALQLSTASKWLTVKKHNNTLLLQQYFPADGQYSFYFLLPGGGITNANQAPTAWRSADYLRIHLKPPILRMVPPFKLQYQFPMAIRECVACSNLHSYLLIKTFDRDGNLQQTSFK